MESGNLYTFLEASMYALSSKRPTDWMKGLQIDLVDTWALNGVRFLMFQVE